MIFGSYCTSAQGCGTCTYACPCCAICPEVEQQLIKEMFGGKPSRVSRNQMLEFRTKLDEAIKNQPDH
uniref:Uncharacterized protein n=1 Tax=Acrobeloides nanus TaxID=290746 RepID=A0A914CJX5_9BILA